MWYRVLIVSLLLFAAGFGAHEVMHLLLIYAVGSQGEIIARPWHLYFLDVSIWSVHAQPVQQLDVVRQSIVNFFGPFLTAVPFAVLLLYVLMGAVWQADAPLLVTPEFNYGVPLAVIGLTALTAGLISAFGGRRIPE